MVPVSERMVGLHLDLKYHMPNKAMLLDWVKRLPGYGINTLLIEYEDKFPFQRYPFIAAPDAFTPAELETFLGTARQAGLMTVPLVQSLSHFEFALDHPDLAHFREAPNVPTQICPSNPAAVEFVVGLMAEVLEFHRDDPYFHCGGDETWFLGTCPACKAWLERDGIIQMWTDHMKKILQPLLDAGKRPIVWDDIFWKDFESVRRVGLPPQTVLHAWNYNITSLTPKSGDSSDSEFGGAGGVLKQIGTYTDAGYASLAAPCLNYGQLFSRHTPSIKNTAVWAKKMHQSDMLGMINTAWACFHVPLPAQNIQVAITGELCRDPDADVGPAWQRRWLEGEFGVADASGVPEAFETIGALWEIPMPAYGRGFSPIIYCYMSMVLHYPGHQEERRRRGAYPVDWDEIDFSAMYQKGLAEVKKGDLTPVFARLDQFLADYPAAVAAFQGLARQATRHRDEAELLALFAEFKLVNARVFSHLLRGDGDVAALRAQLLALKPRLDVLLTQVFEPIGRDRMLRAWWAPVLDALNAASA